MPQRTLSELAELCGAVVEGDGDRFITGPAALAEAQRDEISFYGHPRYARELERTQAGALVVPRELDVPRKDLSLLRCDDANRAFAKVMAAFGRVQSRPPRGVHPSAVVDATAVLGRDVAIGPHCVIGAGAALGDEVVLHPGVVVGARTSIGDQSELYPNVTIYDGVSIGARCTVHSGTVIGADGFGFDPVVGANGFERWDKVPQGGSVSIEDDVEIGANTAIDRGRFAATRIGRGTKIDNLVQVGHNVQIEEHVLLISQVGIAGSSKIGRGAILAGQSGVTGHVEIGAGARIVAGTKCYTSVPPGADYMGFWARPRGEFMRTLGRIEKLGELNDRVRELEKKLAAYEERAR